MPGAGVEPARPNGHMALNHACLPVPAPGQKAGFENLTFNRVSVNLIPTEF